MDKSWTNWNISVMTTGSTYCIIFFLITIYHHLVPTAGRTKHIDNVVIYLTIFHITSWFIQFITSMITYINTKNNLNDDNDIHNYIISTMIILHPIFFYSLWTFRIFNAFQNSIYRLKLIEFIALSVGFSVLFISRFIEQVSWMLVVAGNTPIIPTERLLNCLWTFIAFDVVTRLTLVYLFVRKLFMMVKQQTDQPYFGRSHSSQQSKSNEREKQKKIELNIQQIRLLVVIKKISLLGICSALPLTLSRIIFVIDFLAVDGIFTHKNWIVFNTLQMIAVFVEILAISLTFKFNENMYFIFCKYCDIGCTRCFDTKMVNRKIAGNIELEESNDSSKQSLPLTAPSVKIVNSGSKTEINV